MRNEAFGLMKEQLEDVKHDIETCEIELVDYMEDTNALEALKSVQLRFQATANELETSIEKLQ
jgi:hypothetical protein